MAGKILVSAKNNWSAWHERW